jgi:GT2 family glycosyltransferase
LQSLEQFAPPTTDVIVVDDGSTDEMISRTAREYSRVRVVRHSRSRGFAAAANAGVAAARADVVELLNDDAEVTAGWADAIASFHDPSVVAVAPLVLMHGTNPPRIDSAGDNYDIGGFAFKRFNNLLLQPEHRIPGTVWGVSAAAGFYRRSAFASAGGFPEHFGAYFEDVDLSHRLRKLGQILYEPRSVVYHRVSASYGRVLGRKAIERQSRNEEWVYWRNTERPWRLLPRHAAVLAGKACRRLTEGNLLPWLTGRVRAVMTINAPRTSNG